MPKLLVLEVLTERLHQHVAVQAWARVHPEPAQPSSIEVLKRKRRNAVFRINGLTADGGALIAKRTRQATGEVERLIYEQILPRVPLPSLRCHGFVCEEDGDLCWLFLEDAGSSPYSLKDERHRVLAGHWLADSHRVDVPVAIRDHLPDRDLGHYLRLLHVCRARLLEQLAGTPLSADQTALFRRILTFFDAVESHWSALERACAAMPRTLVHGDFVAKNLHVRHGAMTGALLVFDWQFAGWGVPATDLAQFVDRVASPDLDAYLDRIHATRRPLGEADVRGVAACGNLLRILDQMNWELAGLRVGDPRALSRPAACLQVYADTVPEALSAFRRRCT